MVTGASVDCQSLIRNIIVMFVGVFGEHFRSDVMDVRSHMGCETEAVTVYETTAVKAA